MFAPCSTMSERPARTLELGDEIVADRLRSAGCPERPRLLPVAFQRFGRDDDRLADHLRTGLVVADGVDPPGRRLEGGVDPAGQVLDAAAELVDLAGPRGDPGRSRERRRSGRRPAR